MRSWPASTPRPGPVTLVLDAGALIALERDGDRIGRLLPRAASGRALLVPATVLAQVWRGTRQVRLARLLALPLVTVVPLDALTARGVGSLLAMSGTRDVVDAHVVVVATMHAAGVVTSDPDDLRRLDPRLELLVV